MNKFFTSGVKKVINLKSFLSLLFILTISTTMVLGQGTVKGTIRDKTDNMPLIAVHVQIKGTTTGTVTNYNGEYVIALKAGTYTLQMSYMGYETIEETVTIEDNQIIELNKELSAISFMGEEVIVTMQARGQLSAVNQQLRSNQIINVVSAERIRELPDENAAQAISRLPGIHLDGSKVVIRGIESKMNKIMINGIEMPAINNSGNVSSSDKNTRSTDLSMISANMLSGIEVYKTLTPDMDADAIGGVVNLRFREAQPGLHYSLTTMGTYNQQNQAYGGTKLWASVSNRFLNNRLGAVLNLNYKTSNEGDDRITVSYDEYTSAPIGEGVYYFTGVNLYDEVKKSKNIGGSLVLDYDILNGQLVYTSMLSHTAPEEWAYRDAIDLGVLYHTVILNRNKFTSLLMNNSLLLEQQLGIVKLDASISNISMDKEYDFRYQSRYRATSSPPYYTDSVTDALRFVIKPWEVYDYINPVADSTTRYYETTTIPTNYDEKQWMADLNLEVPLRVSDNIDINFKLGGKYLRKERNYDEELLQDYYPNVVRPIKEDILPWLIENNIVDDVDDDLFFYSFRDNDYDHGDNYMTGDGRYYMYWVIDADLTDDFWLNQVDPELLVSDSRAVREDYWGWERLTAGYAMAEINIGNRLTIIPGVRFEQIHNEYSAPKVVQGTQWYYDVPDTLTKPADHNNWLPHLHLRLRATNWWDIRFSYNNTLSRPDFNHAVPLVYYHGINGSANVGNPYIKPAVSENFDANFTFYSRKMGLVTIGGYLKRVHDIFYMQPTLPKNIPDSTIVAEFPPESGTGGLPSLYQQTLDFYLNSPYTAYIKGIEAEWQSNFSWLPVPFNGIVLNANYTHVWSETKYMQDRSYVEAIPGTFPIQFIANEIDTFYENRLLHQANDIGNVSLGYDWKGLSARLSFRFQGNVISRIDTRPEENEYTDNLYAYDFVIKQNIPLKFADFEVFFNAINFTNVPSKRHRTFYPSKEAQAKGIKSDMPTYERYFGRKFQLGLRLRY